MRFLFRTDTTVKMGTGHFMRCLALAQACKDRGGEVLFLTSAVIPLAFQHRLKTEKIRYESLNVGMGSRLDAKKTTVRGFFWGADCIVLDGYHFGPAYQKYLKERGHRVLLFDDYGIHPKYFADFILNPNILKPYASYESAKAKLFLGPFYAVLRREFVKTRRKKKNMREPKRWIILMGGSDPANMTGKVIKAWQMIRKNSWKVAVVVGPQNPKRVELRSYQSKDISVLEDPKNISALMQRSDFGIIAGGSTCWEMGRLGVPFAAIEVARNQRPLLKTLSRLGICKNLGSPSRLYLNTMARKLRGIIIHSTALYRMIKSSTQWGDGLGTKRVLDQVEQRLMQLSRAALKDCRRGWKWANEPEVRRVSFSQQSIAWKEHLSWFRKKVRDRGCVFYLAAVGQKPAGQIRYEIYGKNAVVSLMLDRKYRGQGYGNDLLRVSAAKLFDKTRVKTIHAYVRPENKDSQRLFIRNFFNTRGLHRVNGTPARHYQLDKS